MSLDTQAEHTVTVSFRGKVFISEWGWLDGRLTKEGNGSNSVLRGVPSPKGRVRRQWHAVAACVIGRVSHWFPDVYCIPRSY